MKKKLLSYLVVVGLALACALNYQLFVFPNRFAPAGLNGLCTMIQYLFRISVGYMSLLINIPLAIWAMVKVSRTMAVRSMVYVVAFSLALILLQRVDLSRFAYETANGTSKILGPLVAGVINGASYSILARCGMDFVAAVVHKKHPEMGFFWIIFLINAIVAGCSYFVYGYQVEPVILCILYSFMSSTVSDRVVRGRRSAVRCEIITDCPEEISEAIITRMHHTATLVPARGMYSNKETHVLLCIVNRNQIPELAELLEEYPHTFAVLSGVSDVIGNFKRLDAHGRQTKNLLDEGGSRIA